MTSKIASMGLLDHAVANTDVADLVILANVETKRDRMQEATPRALASMIGGAPERKIAQRLTKMMFLGLIDEMGAWRYRFQLTEMGAELLRMELEGWSPSRREEERRNSELRNAATKRVGS
jgi:hypothetical protein